MAGAEGPASAAALMGGCCWPFVSVFGGVLLLGHLLLFVDGSITARKAAHSGESAQ